MKPERPTACVITAPAKQVPAFVAERCVAVIDYVAPTATPDTVMAVAVALGMATGRVVLLDKAFTMSTTDLRLKVYTADPTPAAIFAAYFKAVACLGTKAHARQLPSGIQPAVNRTERQRGRAR